MYVICRYVIGSYPVYMIGDNDGIYIDFVGDFDDEDVN
jgi:hypothetical protein